MWKNVFSCCLEYFQKTTTRESEKKNIKILRRPLNTLIKRCVFFWLSVKEFGAFCNKGRNTYFQKKRELSRLILKMFMFSKSPFYDGRYLSFIKVIVLLNVKLNWFHGCTVLGGLGLLSVEISRWHSVRQDTFGRTPLDDR
jgi:hypothetical protein